MTDEFDPTEIVHGDEDGDQGVLDAPEAGGGGTGAVTPDAPPPAGVGSLPDSPPPDLDSDEEPPEPEGHALSQPVADCLGTREFFHGHLPPDLAAIWAHPPRRAMDEATCRVLVSAWGVESFRASQVHQTAVRQAARDANVEQPRTAFRAEREKARGRK